MPSLEAEIEILGQHGFECVPYLKVAKFNPFVVLGGSWVDADRLKVDGGGS